MNIMVIGSIGGLPEKLVTDDFRQALTNDVTVAIIDAIADAGVDLNDEELTVHVALGEPLAPDEMARRLIAEREATVTLEPHNREDE